MKEKNLICQKCGSSLITEDIWCYSTVDPENIIIGIYCNDCDWRAAQLISHNNFVEFDNELFYSKSGDKIIVDQLSSQGE